MLEDLCEVTNSIKFNQSEDGDWSDLNSSPERERDVSFRVKCFRCYGCPPQDAPCKECHGRETVSSTHPLAMLLNDVMSRKFSSGPLRDRQRVETIKEQEEEVQNRGGFCTYCKRQSDFSIFVCPQCPCLFVCVDCGEKTGDHPHELTINVRFSSCKRVSDGKQCHNCKVEIEDCYVFCATCKQVGIIFNLCDQCTDNGSHRHNPNHFFETAMHSPSYNNKIQNIQTVSQDFEGDSKSEVQPFEEDAQKSEEDQYETSLVKKNSSIAEYIQHSIEFEGNQSKAKQQMESSRVHLQVGDLFSSYQFTSTYNSKDVLQAICRKTQAPPRLPLTFTKQSMQPQSRNEFIFADYRCDSCGVQPIKNVRHHCKQCQDYDLCDNCFGTIGRSHFHKFQRLDGIQLRQKLKERLLQNKDVNFRTSSRLPERKLQRKKTGNCQSRGVENL